MFCSPSPQGVGIIAPVLGGWKCESWLVFGRYWLPWTFFEQIIVVRTHYFNKVWTTFSLYSYIKYWQPSVFMFLNSKKLPRKQGSFSCINMCISADSCRHSPAGATIARPPENKMRGHRPLSYLVPLTGLEPVQCRHRGILSPLCLPIPPQRLVITWIYYHIFR